MLFWHVGASTAFIRYAFRDPAMDLRFLALGAILPDVIDLPLGVALWDRFESVRLGAHTMLFAAGALMVVLIVTRRGARRKRWILIAVGALAHLALDAMWTSPATLWWPFLGTEFTASGFATYGEYLRDLLTNPIIWLGEVAGAGYLAYLWIRSGLGDASERTDFLRTGRISAPIERS